MASQLKKEDEDLGTYQTPTECPDCHSPVIKPEGEVVLYCTNSLGCPSQIKGRIEYWLGIYGYEVVTVPASTYHALIDNTAYTSRNTVMAATGYTYRSIYIRIYWCSNWIYNRVAALNSM